MIDMALVMEPTWKRGEEDRSVNTFTEQSIYTFEAIDSVEPITLRTIQEKLEQGVSIGHIHLQDPVYVVKNNNEEELRYNSKNMTLNKIYEVIWNGEQYGVLKTNTKIEILKFEPDKT